MVDTLLDIKNLTVDFSTEDGDVHAVRGIDVSVADGEIVAVVGESGSGKSVSMLSVLGLHPKGRTHIGGEILWKGEDLLRVTEERLREVRGAEISMIFQDPLTALNPVLSVGRQITEMLHAHRKISRGDAKARAVEALRSVGIPQPETRVDNYPHEFSGGMRQRAMVAMALSCDPRLIIADEPTTALDVTVQAQVLELLAKAARESGRAMVLITHDLGVVAGLADRVVVMYAGRVVEEGPVEAVFADPSHPYTIGLLQSLPRLDGDAEAPLKPIGGQPPSMLNPPAGCAFHPRCPLASADAGCLDEMPPDVAIGVGHRSACHRTREVPALLVGSRA